MLKMQVDPDELLKTKGNEKGKRIDLDDCLKTRWLRGLRREVRMWLKMQELEARSQMSGVTGQQPGVRSEESAMSFQRAAGTLLGSDFRSDEIGPSDSRNRRPRRYSLATARPPVPCMSLSRRGWGLKGQ